MFEYISYILLKNKLLFNLSKYFEIFNLPCSHFFRLSVNQEYIIILRFLIGSSTSSWQNKILRWNQSRETTPCYI